MKHPKMPGKHTIERLSASEYKPAVSDLKDALRDVGASRDFTRPDPEFAKNVAEAGMLFFDPAAGPMTNVFWDPRSLFAPPLAWHAIHLLTVAFRPGAIEFVGEDDEAQTLVDFRLPDLPETRSADAEELADRFLREFESPSAVHDRLVVEAIRPFLPRPSSPVCDPEDFPIGQSPPSTTGPAESHGVRAKREAALAAAEQEAILVVRHAALMAFRRLLSTAAEWTPPDIVPARSLSYAAKAFRGAKRSERDDLLASLLGVSTRTIRRALKLALDMEPPPRVQETRPTLSPTGHNGPSEGGNDEQQIPYDRRGRRKAPNRLTDAAPLETQGLRPQVLKAEPQPGPLLREEIERFLEARTYQSTSEETVRRASGRAA